MPGLKPVIEFQSFPVIDANEGESLEELKQRLAAEISVALQSVPMMDQCFPKFTVGIEVVE